MNISNSELPTYWKKEFYSLVDQISNPDLQHFCTNALQEAAQQFWIAPSSSTGRNHPPEDSGTSGLIRHLIKAGEVTKQVARREDFTPYEKDMALAATLLHDIRKNGHEWGESTDYRHGLLGAEYLQEFKLRDGTAKQIIVDTVRYHMAPWNTTLENERYKLLFPSKDPEEQTKREQNIFTAAEITDEIAERKRGSRPHNIIEKCVQEADYWSSRNNMSFMPGRSIDFSLKHDSPE
tara:strand:+ start:1267 stop:1974 length:708 start_codon:yes stop_codon:yes gene_type:complete